jgi:hypothetical protein
MRLDGTDIVALYIALLGEEERLDAFQRAALDRLRGLLYENLSVEELEGIQASYASLNRTYS